MGLNRLSSVVSDALSSSFLDLDVELDVSDGKTLAYLAAHGEVLSRTYHDNRVVVHCRLSQKHLGPLRRKVGIEVHRQRSSQTLRRAGRRRCRLRRGSRLGKR